MITTTATTTPNASSESMNILFVDDEVNILSGLRRMLRGQKSKWNMDFASSGNEALEMMRSKRFDVIVTDMRMPQMNGAELLTQVSDLYPKTVRLVLSGQSEHERVFRSIGPAHQFMSKPCDPDLLVGTINRACSLQNHLQNEGLKEVISKISFLPSLPDIYRCLLHEIESDNGSMDRIGELIASDLSLSAKVLQLVNSSFFGLLQHVGSPKHAAALLGLNIIRPLVLLAGTYAQCEDPKLDGYSLEESVRHSLSVAMKARSIASVESAISHTVDDSYIAGMMHDIGKLILAVNFTVTYQEVLWASKQGGDPLWQTELEMLGTTHAEVGAHLLGLWGFPNSVVEAVAFHHQPLRVKHRSFSPLTAVHIADAFENPSSGGEAEQSLPIDREYLSNLGIEGHLPEWQQIVARANTVDVS